jgi:hypothetical protein
MFIPSASSSTEQVCYIFADFLFREIHLSANRTCEQDSALKFEFAQRDGPLEPFKGERLKILKKGLRRMPLPDGWESSQRLPVPLDMVITVHKCNAAPSCTMKESALSVAVVIAFCCLLRPSEYLTHTKHDDHVLRARSVQFECVLPYHQAQWYGAHEIVGAGIRWVHITMVRIQFLSAKNFDRRASRSIWFSAREHNSVLDLPQILYDWARSTNLAANDFFLSWLIPGTTMGICDSLHYDTMQATLKGVTEAYGFSPRRFGCHGLRVGGASHLRAAGAGNGLILLMGRWKTLPACRGYQEGSTRTHDKLL